MTEIYLDNSATTKPYNEVTSKVCNVMKEHYGNPSSLHKKGVDAEKIIKSAKNKFKTILRCNTNELFFTSSGTEASNIAIIGSCAANRGRHIITSAVEHAASLQSIDYLRRQGYEVDVLDVDRYGMINMNDLSAAIRYDTVLVSIMHVNNEVGTVQPIKDAGPLIKSINPKTLFHVDAVQSFCKIPIFIDEMNIDMLTVSGHKIHGPKGIGALYVRKGTRISPITFGGGQQNGLRPGTEDVAGIAGFGEACVIASCNMDNKMKNVSLLRKQLEKGITERVVDVCINTANASCAPHILNVSFPGIKSEVLLHTLESKGIYVSSGSACSSNKKGAKSYVLTAMGIPDKYIDSSIRLSLSEFTTRQEIEYTIGILREAVPRLRKEYSIR